MNTSSYYIRARFFPTVLTIIPLLIFTNKIISLYFSDSLSNIYEVLPQITNWGLSAALLFLMVEINRLIAKETIEKFYFKEEINMPTTTHLLWTDDYYDKEIKEKIRTKIQEKYNIQLMDEMEETKNELKARKVITTAVSQIKNSLRENKLLLQHNIEYGFFRNLLGGSIIAIVFSIIILAMGLIYKDHSLKLTGLLFCIVYLIPLLFSKKIITKLGNYYSKTLYEQFLTI